MYSVYILRVPDGRVYVGITTDVKRRWNNGNGYRFNQKLWKQIQIYGWDQIEKVIVAEGLTEDEACKLEQEKIKEYLSFDSEHGFNREMGGTYRNKIVPDSVKMYMSKTRSGALNHNYGKHFTDDHKAKIAQSNRGQKRSDETKEKLRIAHGKIVSQYTKSGCLIATYPSGKIASQKTGVDARHISQVCNGRRKSAGGYSWAFT